MARVKPMVLMKPGSVDLAQQWATRINRHAEKGTVAFVSAAVAMGRDLIEARKQLHHGAWGRLFRSHPMVVKNPVCVSQSTANKLMAIARHPVLGNSEHAPNLPADWSALYQLTTLPTPVVTAALRDGRITPALKRRQVRALDPKMDLPRRRRRPVTAARPDLSRQLSLGVGVGRLMECRQLIAQALAWCWTQLDADTRGAFLEDVQSLVQTYRQEDADGSLS